MKPLALRILAFFVLMAIAHSVKPFTRDNMLAFTRASVSSLAEGLPVSALMSGKKTALIASVISQVWQENSVRATAQGKSLTLLAANLPAMQSSRLTPSRGRAPHLRTLAQRQVGWRAKKDISPLLKEAEASDETLVSDELSFPSHIGEETPALLPAKETIALPAVSVWKKVLPMPAVKRDACESPSPSAEPTSPLNETAPEVSAGPEEETMQAAPPLRRLQPTSPLEIEIQPIAYPLSSSTKTRFRVDFRDARKVATKC